MPLKPSLIKIGNFILRKKIGSLLCEVVLIESIVSLCNPPSFYYAHRTKAKIIKHTFLGDDFQTHSWHNGWNYSYEFQHSNNFVWVSKLSLLFKYFFWTFEHALIHFLKFEFTHLMIEFILALSNNHDLKFLTHSIFSHLFNKLKVKTNFKTKIHSF